MENKDFINNYNESDFEEFLKKASTKLQAKTKVHKVISDTSWIEMVEESIPYLDNIIRNPRRFIVQEENIVPIEKAKVVTEESIRHLAQNTGLIQDIDEDGNVIPLKLLNVYREETMDLYENRFIKSLVDNLYQFVNNKLAEGDQKSRVDVASEVSYDGEIKNENEKVNISVKISSKNAEVIESKSKEGRSLETRIEHIKEVIAAFMSSQFLKSLQGAQPVRSPIRKTNVILKEPNFIKALELWEYLESNAIKPMTEVTDEELDRSNDLKEKYDFAFYVQNDALRINRDEKVTSGRIINPKDLKEALQNMVENETSIKDIKAIVNKELKSIKHKQEQAEKKVKKQFLSFLKEYEGRKQKALNLLK